MANKRKPGVILVFELQAYLCRFLGLAPAGLAADELRSNPSSGKRSAAEIARGPCQSELKRSNEERAWSA